MAGTAAREGRRRGPERAHHFRGVTESIPAMPPVTSEGEAAPLERGAVSSPDDERGRAEQRALGGDRKHDSNAPSAGADHSESLRLESHVSGFVCENAIAERAEDGRSRRVVQRRVVHLRDDLGGQEHAHRDLEVGAAAEPAKNDVRPALLRERDSFRYEKATEIAGVALLLADERFDGRDVGVVSRPGRVRTGGRVQMASLGAFSQLELLYRRGDGASFVVGKSNGARPGDVCRNCVRSIVRAPLQ